MALEHKTNNFLHCKSYFRGSPANATGLRVRRGRANAGVTGLVAMALLAAPAPAEPEASAPCAGAAAERPALQAERAAINSAIGDIALGRHRHRRKASGGEGAAGVAGAAASVLLPFGVGALLSAGA